MIRFLIQSHKIINISKYCGYQTTVFCDAPLNLILDIKLSKTCLGNNLEDQYSKCHNRKVVLGYVIKKFVCKQTRRGSQLQVGELKYLALATFRSIPGESSACGNPSPHSQRITEVQGTGRGTPVSQLRKQSLPSSRAVPGEPEPQHCGMATRSHCLFCFQFLMVAQFEHRNTGLSIGTGGSPCFVYFY